MSTEDDIFQSMLNLTTDVNTREDFILMMARIEKVLAQVIKGTDGKSEVIALMLSNIFWKVAAANVYGHPNRSPFQQATCIMTEFTNSLKECKNATPNRQATKEPG